ncbi:hypothetical protein RCL1_006111 [Eukaryota sp. TZLM3-RCL]
MRIITDNFKQSTFLIQKFNQTIRSKPLQSVFSQLLMFIPRTCLLKGLHLIFEHALDSVERFDFSSVFQLALHFGNVSKEFRTLVQKSMTKFFECRTISQEQFKTPFLRRFLTRGSVYVSPFLFKSSVHEFYKPDSNIEFTDLNAIELSLRSPFRRLFPSTPGSLVENHCLRHVEFSSHLLGNSFYFSSQFSALLTLKVSGFRGDPLDSLSFNVQELVNLTCFEVLDPGLMTITVEGLSHLNCLKFIHLCQVKCQDGLHPLVKLMRAEYVCLDNDSLEVLFKNRDNYQFCQLSLESINIPHSLEWIKSGVLTHYKPRLASFDDDCTLFSTNDLPCLKELTIDFYSDTLTRLEVCGNNCLENLYIDMDGKRDVGIKFDPLLYIHVLCLKAIDSGFFYNILHVCPFLKHLELENISFTGEKKVFTKQVQYLQFLQVTGVRGLFANLLCLPKLTTMKLARVSDFHFDQLSVTFPVLKQFSLEFCDIQGTAQPNFSIKFLTISECNLSNGADVISNFSNLRFLRLSYRRIDVNLSLQLPSSLMNLHCSGFFPALCDFLDNVDVICTITLDIEVAHTLDEDERYSLQEKLDSWQSNYQSCRPGRVIPRSLSFLPGFMV